jgi:hypothetical protein
LVEQLSLGHIVGKKIEDDRDPNPCALYAGLAAANPGVYRDSFKKRVHASASYALLGRSFATQRINLAQRVVVTAVSTAVRVRYVPLKFPWVEILVARRVGQIEGEPLCSKLIIAEETEMPLSVLDPHPMRAHPPPLAARLHLARQWMAPRSCRRRSAVEDPI